MASDSDTESEPEISLPQYNAPLNSLGEISDENGADGALVSVRTLESLDLSVVQKVRKSYIAPLFFVVDQLKDTSLHGSVQASSNRLLKFLVGILESNTIDPSAHLSLATLCGSPYKLGNFIIY